MSLSATWYAIRACPAQTVLDKFGLADTGAIDFLGDADWKVAELSTGWTVLCNWSHGKLEVDHAGKLFPQFDVVACDMVESVNLADARGFSGGRQIWRIAHRTESESMDVRTEGTLPPTYAAIASEHEQRQTKERERVDHLFEIPLEAAASVCGYRADQGETPIDTVFKVVERRLPGRGGDRQREGQRVAEGLTAEVTERLFGHANVLGFGPLLDYPSLHGFYGFGGTNVLVRERKDRFEVVEALWGMVGGRPCMDLQFIVRDKVKPRFGRLGSAQSPREKETLKSMFFGRPKIDTRAAIIAAVDAGILLLDAVDGYFSTGAIDTRLTEPQYFDDIVA